MARESLFLLMTYFHGYYSAMALFMGNWLGASLKGNSFLEQDAVTSVLLLGTESVLLDLNHSSIFTLFNKDSDDKFGFLEEEVVALLRENNISDKLDDVRKWYGGYRIESHVMYNPGSVLNYIENRDLMSYRIHTSDDTLIKEHVVQKGVFFKKDFESLLSGETIGKLVWKGLSFTSLQSFREVIWGLLLFSGYLTLTEASVLDGMRRFCELKIPNEEVLLVFQEIQ